MTQRRLLAAALCALALPAMAAERPDPTAESQEHKDQYAALMAMVTSRDMEEYEVSFTPLAFDRVILKDRLGRERLYHYLTFRLRNEITDDTKQLAAKATRYNEILQQAANEYEWAKVEQGVTLKVDGETVLDRKDLKARTRRVPLTVLAYDENGSRIDLLDEPVGSGVQKEFAIPDYGDPIAGSSFEDAREKVEEIVGRRLRSMQDIRGMELPVFDATKVNADGEAAGEVFGVVIFNRINDHGDRFTVEVRGMSNKLRVRIPDTEKMQVENYARTKVLRRVYVLRYERPGDEFYRDQDRFALQNAGWEWVETFQRLQKRSDMAYARYFLANIADDKNAPVEAIESKFWPYYEAVRAGAGDKLPDIQTELKVRGGE